MIPAYLFVRIISVKNYICVRTILFLCRCRKPKQGLAHPKWPQHTSKICLLSFEPFLPWRHSRRLKVRFRRCQVFYWSSAILETDHRPLMDRKPGWWRPFPLAYIHFGLHTTRWVFPEPVQSKCRSQCCQSLILYCLVALAYYHRQALSTPTISVCLFNEGQIWFTCKNRYDGASGVQQRQPQSQSMMCFRKQFLSLC